MITPEYVQTMARHNVWQNENIYGAASKLTNEELRKQDRGAFFGSIHKTLNHIVFADQMWLMRFKARVLRRAPKQLPRVSNKGDETWDDLSARSANASMAPSAIGQSA